MTTPDDNQQVMNPDREHCITVTMTEKKYKLLLEMCELMEESFNDFVLCSIDLRLEMMVQIMRSINGDRF